MKMNKEQYNNIIVQTLANDESAQTESSLDSTRAVLNNMGVALPQGDVSEVSEVLQTNSYMGWESATYEEAQTAANNGTAAIAVSESDVMMIAAEADEDDEDAEAIAASPAVTTVGELTVADASGMEYYTYSSAGTATNVSTPVIDDGQYYLNNRHTGKYMANSDSAVAMHGGTLAALGNTIRWSIIRLDNGYYSIRSLEDTSKFLGVQETPLNSSNLELVTTAFLDLPGRCMWKITKASDNNYRLQNAYNNRYLSTSGAIFLTHAEPASFGDYDYAYSLWRIVSASDFGNSSDYTYQELPESFSINDLYTLVGKPVSPTINTGSIKTLLADPFDFNYSFTSSEFFSVNHLSGKFCGKNLCSNILVSAEHKPTGRVKSFKVNVQPFTIYQTERTMRYDENGEEPEDLSFSDVSVEKLKSLDWINWSDFISHDPSHFRHNWEFMCSFLFSKEPLETVILDMIDHFMSGAGTDYTNDILTEKVKNHESTQTYCNAVISCIDSILSTHNGDISVMEYIAQLRSANPLVDMMVKRGIYQPAYNHFTDKFNGLTITIHGLWGNYINVKSYNLSGNNYSGILEFVFFDNFGLDANDVETFGPLAGFRSWYILQHNNEYNGSYRPFVTVIKFEIPFEGTIS